MSGRFAWLAWSGGEPVGLVDVERYGDGTAGLALVVAPPRRGRGLGQGIVDAVASRPELARTGALRVGVEAENRASVRCLERVGFAPESKGPDGEGFVYFARRIRQAE